jgi:hypothetical protein
MTKEQLIKDALEEINKGFTEVAKQLDTPSMEYRYLLAATYKAERFTRGIIALCHDNLTDESLSLLGSLIEHAITMRWITGDHTQARLKEYMHDLENGSFESNWANKKLFKRMKDIDPKDREYFEVCMKFTYGYAHASAASLGWNEVMDDPNLTDARFKPEAIYVVVAQMLGHVMKALNDQFPGNFTEYRHIWEQVKVDRRIKEKFEKIRRPLK